jgi:hypothetical protein
MSFHRSLIANLQRNGTWLITGTDHQITMTKKFGKRVVEFILEKHKDGLYTIVPTGYEFSSAVSHWDYVNGERRLARNKTIITSFIRTLKAVKMWDYITNKDFVRINPNNKKANIKKIETELSELFRETKSRLAVNVLAYKNK